MNPLSIIGQVVGVIAAAVMIISFQFKENKKLFALQLISTLLFTTHYFLLGLGGEAAAYAGMMQNFGGVIFRVLLLLSEKHEKFKSPFALTAVCAYCAVVAALTFDKSNLIALLPMFANILSMGAMWTRRPNFIRIEQFAVTSPCWLIFNISTFSIAGIFTEAFNLVSIAVYYIRILIRKNKEKKAAKEALPDEKS